MARLSKRKRNSLPPSDVDTPVTNSTDAKRIKKTEDDDKTVIPTTGDDKPFQFLDLAPELRNNIYEKVLEGNGTVFLSRSTAKKKPPLATTSALVRVNKQVKGEFLSIATVVAPIIVTTVKAFNFSHVITFLNRMEDIDIAKFSALTSQPAERVFNINLVFSGYAHAIDYKCLYRWLNRMDNPTKRGTSVQYKYACADTEDAPLLRHSLRGIPALDGGRQVLSKGWYEREEIMTSISKKAKEVELREAAKRIKAEEEARNKRFCRDLARELVK